MAENERFMSDSLWLRSLGEFKRLNVVAFCGMMCALAMVLNMVASINVGPYVRIGFSGIPRRFFPGVYSKRSSRRDHLRRVSVQKEGHPAPRIRVAASGENRCQHPAQHSLAQYAVRKGFPGYSSRKSDLQRGHAADRYGDHVFYASGSGQDDQEIF